MDIYDFGVRNATTYAVITPSLKSRLMYLNIETATFWAGKAKGSQPSHRALRVPLLLVVYL